MSKIELKSEVGVNYPKLCDLLAAQNWLEADLETLEATHVRAFAGISFFFFESLFNLGYPGETPEKKQDAFANLLATN